MKIFKKLLFVMTAVMTLMLVPFSMEKAYAESTNEAKIGTTEYATFSSALSAAQSGDTITLLKDVSQDFISIYDNVTIDLAGHTLTGNVSIYSNTTVKNGKLADGFMSINQDTEKGNHPTGTIQNCEFTSTLSDGRAIAGHENTKLILIDVTVDENRYVSADDCDLEVNGGTFMGGLYPDNAITFVLKGTVTLSEDSVDSVSGYMSSTQAVRKLANGYYTIGEATEDDYVARVGNTKYVTLMQAVNAAKKGDTVYAIKDIDPALFQYGFTRVNKNGITINMQNHSYNGQISAACDYDLDKNNNVVSTPVTLNVYNLKGNEDTILTSEEECTLNLYNLQLGANQQYSFESFADNDNKGKINIYSGNLKGVLSFGENVVVTIMGGTYNLSTVYFNETATISVRAGKFSSYSYNRSC